MKNTPKTPRTTKANVTAPSHEHTMASIFDLTADKAVSLLDGDGDVAVSDEEDGIKFGGYVESDDDVEVVDEQASGGNVKLSDINSGADIRNTSKV